MTDLLLLRELRGAHEELVRELHARQTLAGGGAAAAGGLVSHSSSSSDGATAAAQQQHAQVKKKSSTLGIFSGAGGSVSKRKESRMSRTTENGEEEEPPPPPPPVAAPSLAPSPVDDTKRLAKLRGLISLISIESDEGALTKAIKALIDYSREELKEIANDFKALTIAEALASSGSNTSSSSSEEGGMSIFSLFTRGSKSVRKSDEFDAILDVVRGEDTSALERRLGLGALGDLLEKDRAARTAAASKTLSASLVELVLAGCVSIPPARKQALRVLRAVVRIAPHHLLLLDVLGETMVRAMGRGDYLPLGDEVDWRPTLTENAQMRAKLLGVLKFAAAPLPPSTPPLPPPLSSGAFLRFATSIVRSMRVSNNAPGSKSSSEEEASVFVLTLAEALSRDKAPPKPWFLIEAVAFLAGCGTNPAIPRKRLLEVRAALVNKQIAGYLADINSPASLGAPSSANSSTTSTPGHKRGSSLEIMSPALLSSAPLPNRAVSGYREGLGFARTLGSAESRRGDERGECTIFKEKAWRDQTAGLLGGVVRCAVTAISAFGTNEARAAIDEASDALVAFRGASSSQVWDFIMETTSAFLPLALTSLDLSGVGLVTTTASVLVSSTAAATTTTGQGASAVPTSVSATSTSTVNDKDKDINAERRLEALTSTLVGVQALNKLLAGEDPEIVSKRVAVIPKHVLDVIFSGMSGIANFQDSVDVTRAPPVASLLGLPPSEDEPMDVFVPLPPHTHAPPRRLGSREFSRSPPARPSLTSLLLLSCFELLETVARTLRRSGNASEFVPYFRCIGKLALYPSAEIGEAALSFISRLLTHALEEEKSQDARTVPAVAVLEYLSLPLSTAPIGTARAKRVCDFLAFAIGSSTPASSSSSPARRLASDSLVSPPSPSTLASSEVDVGLASVVGTVVFHRVAATDVTLEEALAYAIPPPPRSNARGDVSSSLEVRALRSEAADFARRLARVRLTPVLRLLQAAKNGGRVQFTVERGNELAGSLRAILAASTAIPVTGSETDETQHRRRLERMGELESFLQFYVAHDGAMFGVSEEWVHARVCAAVRRHLPSLEAVELFALTMRELTDPGHTLAALLPTRHRYYVALVDAVFDAAAARSLLNSAAPSPVVLGWLKGLFGVNQGSFRTLGGGADVAGSTSSLYLNLNAVRFYTESLGKELAESKQTTSEIAEAISEYCARLEARGEDDNPEFETAVGALLPLLSADVNISLSYARRAVQSTIIPSRRDPVYTALIEHFAGAGPKRGGGAGSPPSPPSQDVMALTTLVCLTVRRRPFDSAARLVEALSHWTNAGDDVNVRRLAACAMGVRESSSLPALASFAELLAAAGLKLAMNPAAMVENAPFLMNALPAGSSDARARLLTLLEPFCSRVANLSARLFRTLAELTSSAAACDGTLVPLVLALWRAVARGRPALVARASSSSPSTSAQIGEGHVPTTTTTTNANQNAVRACELLSGCDAEVLDFERVAQIWTHLAPMLSPEGVVAVLERCLDLINATPDRAIALITATLRHARVVVLPPRLKARLAIFAVSTEAEIRREQHEAVERREEFVRLVVSAVVEGNEGAESVSAGVRTCPSEALPDALLRGVCLAEGVAKEVISVAVESSATSELVFAISVMEVMPPISPLDSLVAIAKACVERATNHGDFTAMRRLTVVAGRIVARGGWGKRQGGPGKGDNEKEKEALTRIIAASLWCPHTLVAGGEAMAAINSSTENKVCTARVVNAMVVCGAHSDPNKKDTETDIRSLAIEWLTFASQAWPRGGGAGSRRGFADLARIVLAAIPELGGVGSAVWAMEGSGGQADVDRVHVVTLEEALTACGCLCVEDEDWTSDSVGVGARAVNYILSFPPPFVPPPSKRERLVLARAIFTGMGEENEAVRTCAVAFAATVEWPSFVSDLSSSQEPVARSALVVEALASNVVLVRGMELLLFSSEADLSRPLALAGPPVEVPSKPTTPPPTTKRKLTTTGDGAGAHVRVVKKKSGGETAEGTASVEKKKIASSKEKRQSSSPVGEEVGDDRKSASPTHVSAPAVVSTDATASATPLKSPEAAASTAGATSSTTPAATKKKIVTKKASPPSAVGETTPSATPTTTDATSTPTKTPIVPKRASVAAKSPAATTSAIPSILVPPPVSVPGDVVVPESSAAATTTQPAPNPGAVMTHAQKERPIIAANKRKAPTRKSLVGMVNKVEEIE